MNVGRIAFGPRREPAPITFSELTKAHEDSNIWKFLESEFAGVTSERPADSVTPQEYAEAFRMSVTASVNHLEKKVAAGELQRQWYRPLGKRPTRVYVRASRTGTSDSKPSRKGKKIPLGNVEVQPCPSLERSMSLKTKNRGGRR